MDEILNNNYDINDIELNYSIDNNFKYDEQLKKLFINSSYYNNNATLVDELICKIIKKSESKSFVIPSKKLITKNVIRALSDSKYIVKILLGKNDEENNYSLSKEDYLLFKGNSQKVMTYSIDPDLEETFDDTIVYNYPKPLIGHYTYLKLQEPVSIVIREPLTQKEIDNFKYIPSNGCIKLTDVTFNYTDKIIEVLKDNHLHCRIIYDINDKKTFNKYIFDKNFDYSNMFFGDDPKVPLEYYKKCEKKLDSIVESAKELSPLEKYLYFYNIVAKYKEYNDNENDIDASRNIYFILFNEYMVCVGFANLLSELCKRAGIKTIDYDVTFDTSYDDTDLFTIPIPEKIPIEKGEHLRLKVYIKDEKYGVEGIYIADPTWDNFMSHDLFIHALLTEEQMSKESRYFFVKDYIIWKLLYSAKSMDEFYTIYSMMSKYYSCEEDFIFDMINEYKNLDIDFYNNLVEKYPYIKTSQRGVKTNEDLSPLINDIAIYIVNNNKKQIPGDVIMTAVYSFLQKTSGLSKEELESKLNTIIEDNYELYKEDFPTRYNMKDDGTLEEYIHSENPFDITIDDIQESRR